MVGVIVTDVEALLRDLEPADLSMPPPPPRAVWEGIESALAHDDDRVVVSLSAARTRRRIRLLGAVAAAAAAVAVIIGASVVIDNGEGATVVSAAELEHESDFDPLGAGATARAGLIDRDGTLESRLVDAGLPDPDDGDLELWLIAADPTDGLSTSRP